MSVMHNGISPSSDSCIPLVDVKNETRLVLQAFLNQTVAIPLRDRPGRVGGAYKEHNKYSTSIKSEEIARNGQDSEAEDASSADEKSTGFQSFIKQLPLRNSPKDAKSSQEKESKPKLPHLKGLADDDLKTPSSTSEEDEGEKKQNKKLSKKKLKHKLSKFFKLKLEKQKEDPESPPQRPSSLAINTDIKPVVTLSSPNHPPEFYDEVAEKLKRIAKRSTSMKKPAPKPVEPVPHSPRVYDKELVVQQLIEVISSEGDAINTKIQSDPFIRSTLSRISYPSFAKLLDTVGGTQECQTADFTPSPSPTLQRIAITMEVSGRIVTATGTQRIQGFAERYMENFIPWVKNHGGWENVVDLEEYD